MTATDTASAPPLDDPRSGPPVGLPALGPAGGVVVPAIVSGFGIAVLMWAIGYVTHLRQGMLPGPVVFALLLAALLGGGWLIGRLRPDRPVAAGAIAGATASLVNLLILGSVVSGEEGRASFALAALGSIVAATAACVGAAVLGARSRAAGTPRMDAADWRHAMVVVTCVATFFVVIAGGLVTSTETGLAVPDWPNTFGSNMFAYPLEKMVGGVYYEHAHRLYGSLVGMCTIATAVVVLGTREPRRWVRWMAVAAVPMVIVQGLMGGLRVTGSFTLAVEGEVLRPNTGLAITHGIFGQCFLAYMVALAAATSRAWRFLPAAPADEPADRRAAAGRGLTAALLVVLLVQLATGAGYRHTYTVEEKLPWPAHLHLTLAMFAVIMCIIAGMKAWARDGDTGRPLRRTGLAMNVAVMLQTLLGGAALIAILARDDQPYAAEVLLATAHQANGALVLAVAGLLFAWTRRLPAPLTDEEREAAGLPIVRTSVDVDFGPRSDLSEPAASPVDESAKPVTV